MKLFEKETSIWWSEENDDCFVLTYNRGLQSRLDKLAESRDDCVLRREIKHEGEVMAKEYHINKRWVKIHTPKVLTEEQREKLREQGRKNILKLHPVQHNGDGE